MLFQIKSYFNFLWHSKNAHGVHSPFVFNLVTKCFYDSKQKPEYEVLKKYRNTLLQDKNYIEVIDFGAGSKVFKSNKRQASKIAKTAGISQKRAELLFRITNYFKPLTILELGSSLGLATSALALNDFAVVTTVEGCTNTMNKLQLQLQEFYFKNIDCSNSEFSSFLKNHHPNPKKWELIYFDGNHSKEATLEYFDLLLPTITNNTVWIFDDIHWSKEMNEAWEIIKKKTKVTVTIDTFQWGFVFFRSEQLKENFTIRTYKSLPTDTILGIKNLWGLLH